MNAERIKRLRAITSDTSVQSIMDKCLNEIEQLQAEKKELIERIELAIFYLPECPDRAKSFLESALKGE